ncbi:MAG TPA: penicillin acylase family protein [Vicinamibacterales bacterium]|nr:penicillin acylase family protein [Vicinamibacterales bacterium]
MLRLVLKALGAIVVLVLIALAAVYVLVRRSLPEYNATEQVAGITADVDIVRDRSAIPHIFAKTKKDALFGLGYVHAQDRLWQMEFQRRIGFGRLSEIVGPATIPQDRFLRTVGFGRAAVSAWEHLPAPVQQDINAYVAGVNAFISTHHGTALPPEFTLLRFEPQPWTGSDVIAWVKMMAWDLSANYSFELLRNDLVAKVGMERMQQLMPLYPKGGLSILDRAGEAGEAGTAGKNSVASAHQPYLPHQPYLAAGREFFSTFQDGIGSNNWVVDGSMTASGKPMLANDPHLGTRIPSTWYLAHMSAPDFDVIGGTLPGAPTVVLGRNRRIAWGMTNVAADVEDLYREHIDASGRTVEFRGAQEPITVIPETIVVKGAPPIQLNVRVTRHGPLVSDAINANEAESKKDVKSPPLEPLAFRWTALDPEDSTVIAILKLNEASNWNDFTDALKYFVVPSQNLVYADVDGHIGYYAPAHIPIRASGDGTLPADGWTGDAEWTGWVPFEDLPHLYDPPDHLIVTANHRPAPEDYKYNLGFEWYTPHRAQRIVDLLKGRSNLTPDDFAKVQGDTLSLHAKELLPLLLQHVHPDNTPDQQAVDIVKPWDYDTKGDSAAAAIYEAWFYQLGPAIVGDDLGPIVGNEYNLKTTFMARFVAHAIATNDTAWCDDKTTAHEETCDEAVTRALHEAVVDLTRRMGGDMKKWRWDAIHRAIFPHQGLDAVAALRPLVSRSMPNGGDWSTVDVGTVAFDQKYEQHLIPGYREIIDLSPANDSRFLDAVGQSGHWLSPHYDDFLADWRNMRYRPMTMDRGRIEEGSIGHLRLAPVR